ncbi:MAG: sugar ABC transporter substrate-binding protein [Eubacteriales bacterium]|nr:sugar ABC transporter substrate-binding protein [Eubacteriales bacterium]
MKKKVVAVFLTAMLGCVMLAGCKKNVGTPEDNAVVEEEEEQDTEEKEGNLFGYSCIDIYNPYFDILKESIRGELEAKGDTLLVKNPDGDAQKQIQQIEEMIEEGVDAVFLSPVDWEAITPALEMLDEAEIPVINVDTQVKETDLTEAYIGSDNKNAGAVCGENLKLQCPDGGKIVLLECPSQNSVNDRITGFEEAIKNAGFEVVVRADAGGNKAGAKEKMSAILKEHPQIDAVMCGNDQMALGALEAAKEAGKTSLKIYGVDGSPELKSELAKEKSMIAGSGAQSPINVGKQAAKIARAILAGEDYEETTYVDTFFIGKENVEMYGTNGWQ